MIGLVLALWVSPAHAGDLSTDPRILKLEQVAGAHWRAVPDCPDGIYVEEVPLPYGIVGLAEMPGCHIQLIPYLVDNQPAWMFCTQFVHEYGHLLGHTHQDSDPVMWSQEPPECAAMTRAANPPTPKWRRLWHWRVPVTRRISNPDST